jgi:hypothetical protein
MPATLLQKTRGTQSATNTLAPASNLQPITSDEQNCIKQTTFGQSAVFPEESIPFVDLQNHADNVTLNTNKTGFKNYFNQETLNNFFGWNTGTSTFKTYAGGAGKILAGFLDPAWLSTLFTVNSVIDDKKNIRSFKMYRNLASSQSNVTTFPAWSITHSTFLSALPGTRIPVTELNSTVFITSNIEVWLITNADITTDFDAQKQAKIRPFWREETSPNVWSGKNYLASDERNISFSQFYRAVRTIGGSQFSFRYPLSLEVSILRTNLNNLDFGFDIEFNNIGPGAVTNFNNLQLEISSGTNYNSIKIEQFKT